MKQLIFPNQEQKALFHLNEKGFDAFVIGGAIRSLILNQEVHDYDIVTNANLADIKSVFSDFQVIDTGLKHGTVTVIIDWLPIEVSEYRNANELSLLGDINHRDFTINTLAYSPKSGLIDYLQGLEDMKRKLIRTVNQPKDRFGEDPIRILRALRFASELGFRIEDQTKEAINKLYPWLGNVAIERIRDEFMGVLTGKVVKSVLLEFQEVLYFIIPEIKQMIGFNQNNPYHIYDCYTHTVEVIDHLPQNKTLRLAGLFHDIGKPSTYSEDEKGRGHFYRHGEVSARLARTIMNRLKIDNETMVKVLKVIEFHDYPLLINKKALKKLLNRISIPFFNDLLIFRKADIMGQNPKYLHRLEEIDQANQFVQEILQNKECFSFSNLNINGHHLVELGFYGRQVGDILNQVLHLVIQEKLKNEYEILIDYVKKKYKMESK